MEMKFTDHLYVEIEYFTWKWSFILFWGSLLLTIICAPFHMLAYTEYSSPALLQWGMSSALILLAVRLINFKVFTGRWLGYKD
ncbi:hypothetical protein AB6F65_11705 [Providencia hangzhouensis]|uniref:hypothetical protein n=1 Tax=Providencia hangzhouensis TaxID=3031799 RepID=UPI0034DDAD4B